MENFILFVLINFHKDNYILKIIEKSLFLCTKFNTVAKVCMSCAGIDPDPVRKIIVFL